VSQEKNTPPLADLRAQIDALDYELIELLARRMSVVAELSRVKRAEGLRIRDAAREKRVLEDRTSRGKTRGLSREFSESLFRVIMRASREYQATLKVELPVTLDPKRIAIVGGEGGMGRRFAELFRGLGHQVLIADLDTALRPIEAAQQADVTIVSVPIRATLQVIDEVGPHVPAHGLLMDLTSIKEAPVAHMLRATQASVLGTHPMFGPGVHTLQDQRVVLCAGRGDAWADWIEQNLRAWGLVTTRATAEEHDRAMACVQVLTHFQTQVLGVTLARMGFALEDTLRFTSPAYLIELYVAARHFAQDPALYGAIEMENPRTHEVTQAFRAAAASVQEILDDRDQAGFQRLFEEVRAFFGAFTKEASEQGAFLIERVVERS
jgi:chorismate mutase / prephenate dehydrogenase